MKVFSNIIILLTIIFISCNDQNLEDEEKAVLETLENFQRAILENDKETASILLIDEVEILEYGIVETKEEYLSEHFFYDGRFLQAMNSEVENQNIRIRGNVAWVSTKSHVQGTYGDREHDLNFLELVVLEKIDLDWKISALHWSSRSRNE